MSQTEGTTDGQVVVGLGEVLWDVFPSGPRFGGAPANFACTTAGLSAETAVFMVSSVGHDELGQQARRELQQRRVDTTYLADSERPTGTVTVRLDDSGHASYEFAADTAWDALIWSAVLQDLAARTDAVCFGTLGQRSETSRQTIRQFLQAVPETALRVFDINLRPPFYSDQIIRESLQLANGLKLNEDELPIVARLHGISGSEAEMLQQLAGQLDLRMVALTKGSQGALLLADGQLSQHPGIRTKVTDTVGAGDAFTAALVLGLLAGDDPSQILDHASKVAAYVCTQRGATPDIPAELKR